MNWNDHCTSFRREEDLLKLHGHLMHLWYVHGQIFLSDAFWYESQTSGENWHAALRWRHWSMYLCLTHNNKCCNKPIWFMSTNKTTRTAYVIQSIQVIGGVKVDTILFCLMLVFPSKWQWLLKNTSLSSIFEQWLEWEFSDDLQTTLFSILWNGQSFENEWFV